MREIIVRYNDGNDHMAVRGGEYVQDLVRCKDCKAHYDVNENPAHIMCGYMSDDDFCSYGEVRDE